MNRSRTAQNQSRAVMVPTLYRWNRNQNRKLGRVESGKQPTAAKPLRQHAP